MQDRGEQIVDMHGTLGNIETQVIGQAKHPASFDPATGEPHGKRFRMLVPAVIDALRPMARARSCLPRSPVFDPACSAASDPKSTLRTPDLALDRSSECRSPDCRAGPRNHGAARQKGFRAAPVAGPTDNRRQTTGSPVRLHTCPERVAVCCRRT